MTLVEGKIVSLIIALSLDAHSWTGLKWCWFQRRWVVECTREPVTNEQQTVLFVSRFFPCLAAGRDGGVCVTYAHVAGGQSQVLRVDDDSLAQTVVLPWSMHSGHAVKWITRC